MAEADGICEGVVDGDFEDAFLAGPAVEMEEDAFWGIAGGALEAELGGGGVGVDFQFEGDGAELGGDVVEAGEAAGLDPFSGEGL